MPHVRECADSQCVYPRNLERRSVAAAARSYAATAATTTGIHGLRGW